MRNSLVAMFFVITSFSVPVRAATIYYQPNDVIDSIAGEDVWQYRYTVTNFNFSANQGFSIVFDRNLYEKLQSPPPQINADWDVLTLQPDPALPDDGLYDALALVDGASLDDPFPVQFVFLGTGTPGSQRFTINQFDAQGNFERVLESGVTQLIPEPSALILALSGLACLITGRKLLGRL